MSASTPTASELKRVRIYTDGGCKPNPGPGGWGAIIRFDDHEWTLSGNDPRTTNNRMEMQAAVAALALLGTLFGRCDVELYTDSEYLRQGITDWVAQWVQNQWRTQQGEPVKNKKLWHMLHELTLRHAVAWHWLKGHAGHAHNERADRLATKARAALRSPTQASAESQAVKGPHVDIFVKASYRLSRQTGGWAVLLRTGDRDRTMTRQEKGASANALLIRAATEGLLALTRPCSVVVYSDADYLIRGASQWVRGWLARGWVTRDGKPVANRPEWESLLDAARPHDISWQLASAEQMPELAYAADLAAETAAETQSAQDISD